MKLLPAVSNWNDKASPIKSQDMHIGNDLIQISVLDFAPIFVALVFGIQDYPIIMEIRVAPPCSIFKKVLSTLFCFISRMLEKT